MLARVLCVCVRVCARVLCRVCALCTGGCVMWCARVLLYREVCDSIMREHMRVGQQHLIHRLHRVGSRGTQQFVMCDVDTRWITV